jgi:succinyl-diaminopimelate desuccinylase
MHCPKTCFPMTGSAAWVGCMADADAPDAATADLLAALVRIPSVNPAFGQPGDPDEWFNEGRMAGFVAGWLRDLGLDVETDAVAPDRPNVIARLKGKGNGPAMLWEGHLDTVQVTGMSEPFTPRVERGRLYGRGAVDDKGCLAAFMLALRDLVRDPPPGDVTFLAAVDEEYRFAGITHHLKRGERYDLGIAGEPTNLRIVRACKGCVRWHVEVLGRAAHTAKPHEGVDAVVAATGLLAGYRRAMEARTATHPLLGRSTLVCTGFEAGEGPNTVPSRAMLRFDYRYLPSEEGAEVWRDFEALTARLAAEAPEARFIVHPPFIDSSAMDVPATSPIVALLGGVCQGFGIDPEPQGVPYGSDATKMVDIGGVPTVVFGPGSIDQAHAKDEFVTLAEVTKAAAMLVRAAHATSGDRG